MLLILKKKMLLISDYSEFGYQQLKKDRDLIENKINHYKALLEDINLAIPYLESIFEPNIEIDKDKINSMYVAICYIPFNNNEKVKIMTEVCPISNFDNIQDSQLIKLANSKIRDKIKLEFPQHFIIENDLH